jgi:hypothetical protein
MSFEIGTTNATPNQVEYYSQGEIKRVLTESQKAFVKNFFKEFKADEAITFFKNMKAIVSVEHFPITLLISKDRNGLYHDNYALQKLIETVPVSVLENVFFETVSSKDPKKVSEELENIRAKYTAV